MPRNGQVHFRNLNCHCVNLRKNYHYYKKYCPVLRIKQYLILGCVWDMGLAQEESQNQQWWSSIPLACFHPWWRKNNLLAYLVSCWQITAYLPGEISPHSHDVQLCFNFGFKLSCFRSILGHLPSTSLRSESCMSDRKSTAVDSLVCNVWVFSRAGCHLKKKKNDTSRHQHLLCWLAARKKT